MSYFLEKFYIQICFILLNYSIIFWVCPFDKSCKNFTDGYLFYFQCENLWKCFQKWHWLAFLRKINISLRYKEKGEFIEVCTYNTTVQVGDCVLTLEIYYKISLGVECGGVKEIVCLIHCQRTNTMTKWSLWYIPAVEFMRLNPSGCFREFSS